MRFLVKVSIPTPAGNVRVLDGSLGQTIESILNEMSPEAAYFSEEDGARTGYIFCNIEKESDIPAIAEPWFLAFGARVELRPAMTVGDLRRASTGFENAITRYSPTAKAS